MWTLPMFTVCSAACLSKLRSNPVLACLAGAPLFQQKHIPHPLKNSPIMYSTSIYLYPPCSPSYLPFFSLLAFLWWMTPISELLTNYSPLIWVKRLLSTLEPLPTPQRPCASPSHPAQPSHPVHTLRRAKRWPYLTPEQTCCHYGNNQSDRGVMKSGSCTKLDKVTTIAHLEVSWYL